VPVVVEPGGHPTEDRDEVHEVYRAWRRIADSYEGTRVLVGEVWVPDATRFAAYLRPDEMHTAFNFDFMSRPWDSAELRASIDLMLDAHAPVGAPSTWVLSNHDVTRPVTRYGREDSSFAFAAKRFGTPTDLDLGTRRARAAALLTAALPGSLYLYQGDELGLPEVELPREVLEDPMHFRSGGVDPGRDGCRVPLPWRGAHEPFGFSPAGASDGLGTVAAPWLPQPAEWAALTVQAQEADPGSMLWLYRQALRIRKRERGLGDGSLSWLESEPDVLVFARGDDFVNVTNLGDHPVALPDHQSILLASTPLVGGLLPPDSTAWLRRSA
jgi:alpha-glucosidase